ncbi:MAG: hypothetical protein KDD24_05140 [Flavobacteriales bacterium]|nr:hypothetical protein [Flavobacteriales bacterium]MCB9174352.1 hypothetical protein [Flavobacteriales bacterium]
MKKLNILSILSLVLFLSSCIIVDNSPGPNGRDGLAYFGVDYDRRPPYSYWDNNNSIPYNPILGEYYRSAPGTYRFEYFVNEFDYWYGTYQIWVNRGGPGRPNGRPGIDATDNYMMLICNPNGFYEYRENWKLNENEPLVIDQQIGEFYYKITIQKGSTLTRKSQSPKFIRESK